MMPKKQRVIEGVGVSSMMALQAQLYRTQVRLPFEFPPSPSAATGLALLGAQLSPVDAARYRTSLLYASRPLAAGQRFR